MFRLDDKLDDRHRADDEFDQAQSEPESATVNAVATVAALQTFRDAVLDALVSLIYTYRLHFAHSSHVTDGAR